MSDSYPYNRDEVNAFSAKHFNERAIEHEQKADEKLKNAKIVITSGDGIKLWVRNGMLVLKHGATHLPREDKQTIFNKGVHNTRAIYIQSETGYITLDALAWTKRQGIEVVVFDMHGALTFTNVTPLSNAKLRRAQYQMHETDMLEHTAKQIIIKKTTAQLDVLNTLPLYRRKKNMNVINSFQYGIERITTWNTITEIMLEEGRLANIYWDYFTGLPLKWERKDVRYTPAHWLYITKRRSYIYTQLSQVATNPFHAAINYCYALLESQVRRSIYTAGLDAACGILHYDKEGRDSLVFDVMEVFRAPIDLLVFKEFRKLTLKFGDCLEGELGECRLNPELTRLFLASCRVPQSAVDAEVAWLVSLLAPVG